MLIAVVGMVCVAVAALGRKVKKEREMATWRRGFCTGTWKKNLFTEGSVVYWSFLSLSYIRY